jgi:hypothetical protein
MRFAGQIIILAAAALGVWPLVRTGPSCGPDFSFHLVSWIEAQRSFLHGIVYPHWASGPNFGAGEPRFVFYPPLTWFAGALLGLVVPWSAVSTVIAFLMLAATGLANRALARQMMADGPATLAGCASIFLGNMLVDVYMRSDFAELAGGFWIPLLLLFQLGSNTKTTVSGTLLQRMLIGAVPLTLVVTGIWFTNGPLGIMTSYLLVATAIVSSAIRKSWEPMVRAAIAFAIGTALAAVYLVPAIWERGWANIGSAISDPQYLVENGWLFSHSSDAALSRSYMMLDVHSWLALAMFGLCAASVGIAWKRGMLTAQRAWWIPLALIPIAALLMHFPFSEPLWKWLPALRYLQFPWRWLVVMNAPLAVFFAAAVWVNQPRGKIALCVACTVGFFVITGVTSGICFQNCHDVENSIPLVEHTQGIRGKPEYSPAGIRHPLVEPGVAGNCEVTNVRDLSPAPADDLQADRHDTAPACTGNFSQMVDLPEHKVFAGTAEHAGDLILHLRSYPAWRITVNGRSTGTTREQENGLISVSIPQGQVMVAVDWTTTPDVWIGRALSALALALLAVIVLAERKLSQPQSS